MNIELLVSEELVEAQVKKHEKADTTEELEFGLVIYTDGGCQNGNPAMGIPNLSGYGIHGFVYANTPTKVGAGINGYTVSNHGYILNGRIDHEVSVANIYKVDQKPTGVNVKQVQPIAYIDGVGGLHDATNNVAEGTAFLRSLDLVERAYHQLKIKTVHFRLDSKYVINNVLSRFFYIQNNWINRTGKQVANQDLWIEVAARLEELAALPIEWTIEWTEGHSDYFGNIQADKLATAGRIAAVNGHYFDHLKVSPAQGHWSTNNALDFKANPSLYFLVDSKWYHDSSFELETRSDGLTPLFLGNHDEPERVGQADGDTTISIALVKEPPRHLPMIIDIARSLDYTANGFETHGMFFGNMNNVLKPDFEEQMITFKDRFLLINNHKKQVLTFDKKDIVTRLSPAYIVGEQLRKFRELHDSIDRVVDGKLFKHEALTDITHEIYDVTVDKKGKEVWKCKLDNEPFFKTNVKVNQHTADYVYEECIYDVTLTYGITAPRRRVLSGIKDHNPKVYILTTFDAYIGFRYYSILKLPNGEWGIWTNPDANLRVF